jgi:hypothetical protein
MDRRRFLLTSLAGALAAPLVAEAQQAAKIARIGWLGDKPAGNPHLREAFLQASTPARRLPCCGGTPRSCA